MLKQIDNKSGITQVTSSPPTPPSATSLQQQQQNNRSYYSSQQNNTILHKALNEKFQINTKLLNGNNNSISSNNNSISSNNSCSSNDSNYENNNKLQYSTTISNPITTTIISATNSLSPFSGMFTQSTTTTNEIKSELIDHSLQQQHQQQQINTNNKITKRTRSSRPATVNQLLSNHVTPSQPLTSTTTVKHITPITKLTTTTTNEHPTITIVNNNQQNSTNNENENNTNINNNIKVIKCNKPAPNGGDGGSHISTILIKHQPSSNLYVPSSTPQQQQQHHQNGIDTTTSSPIIRNCLKSSQFIPTTTTTTILKPLINSGVNQTTTIITPTVSKSVQILNKPTITGPKLADL